jgi:hypothetical protein
MRARRSSGENFSFFICYFLTNARDRARPGDGALFLQFRPKPSFTDLSQLKKIVKTPFPLLHVGRMPRVVGQGSMVGML